MDLQSALLKFEEASEVAPTYARPYCGISQCSAEVALRGTSSSSELVTRAKVAALKAIELDPEMIDSYACLGSAQALDWDWSAVEQSFAHGIQLGLHVSSSRRYAMFLAALMRFDEALHHLEMAQRIDPFSNRQKVAQAKFQHITRRYSEGVSELSERFMYGSFPVEARFLLALMSAHLGDRARARLLIESVRPDSGAQLPMMAGVAEILALIGEMDEANQIVNAFNLLSLDTRISRFRQALLALALRNKRDSLSLLTQAVNDQEAELLWLRVEPRFDPIRGEPAFADLLHTVFPHAYI